MRLDYLIVMKINSSQLEAFYAIAKTLNFTRASEVLFVTQSALSQRIAKLEEELEATLFIRDRSALKLTDAGEQLLRFCQLNSHAESELLAKLKNTNEQFVGSLRIAGFSSVNRSLVVPALQGLLLKNPQLSLNLITKELRELPQLLKTAEVDYILTNKRAESSDIENVYLGTEENILVESKHFSDTESYLDHDESDPTTKAYFTVNKIKFRPKTYRYLDDVYGLLDGIRHGLGKAVVPVHLIEGDRSLQIIDPKRKLLVPVYLQFYKQSYYRKIHSIFLGEIKKYFKKSLPQYPNLV
jgi:DNA-binding transcriptional LysR family regulator